MFERVKKLCDSSNCAAVFSRAWCTVICANNLKIFFFRVLKIKLSRLMFHIHWLMRLSFLNTYWTVDMAGMWIWIRVNLKDWCFWERQITKKNMRVEILKCLWQEINLWGESLRWEAEIFKFSHEIEYFKAEAL